MTTVSPSIAVPPEFERFQQSIEATRALAFIRGYVRAAKAEKNDERMAQILDTVEKKATEGLIKSGVEVAK